MNSKSSQTLDKSNLLVDSSVWINALRPNIRSQALRLRLIELLRAGSVLIDGIVVAELIQGVKHDKEKRELQLHLEGVPYLPHSRGIYERAGQWRGLLLKKGITVSLTDTIVAATAYEYDIPVLTLDRDFLVFDQIRVEVVDL